jgi:hypothetical protein
MPHTRYGAREPLPTAGCVTNDATDDAAEPSADSTR